MPAMFKVERNDISRRMSFPLVQRFIHTGEEHNPYRCECCATKPQIKKATETKTTEVIQAESLPRPECCRKCGMDF